MLKGLLAATVVLGVMDVLVMLVAFHAVGAAFGGSAVGGFGRTSTSFFHIVAGWQGAGARLTQIMNNLPNGG